MSNQWQCKVIEVSVECVLNEATLFVYLDSMPTNQQLWEANPGSVELKRGQTLLLFTRYLG